MFKIRQSSLADLSLKGHYGYKSSYPTQKSDCHCLYMQMYFGTFLSIHLSSGHMAGSQDDSPFFKTA